MVELQQEVVQDACFTTVLFYYQPEVRRGKYWGLGVFLLQYFPLVNK